MRKKRILHVFGLMNCGGAETMLMNIYRNIDREKFEFSFLVHETEPGHYDSEIKQLNGKIFSISSQGKAGLIRYILTLKKFLLQNGPFDIVHSHMDWQGGAIAFACHLAKIDKIIVHSHTYASYKPNFILNQVIKLEQFWINKYGTDFWACSKEAGSFLFNKDKNLKVIPNSINLPKYLNPNLPTVSEIRARYNISPDTLILGHIGNFSPTKNQKFLIEIANKLNSLNKNFKLMLVGNDSSGYAKEVKELVVKYELQQKVHFLGLRDDIYNVVKAFDIFCFPSEFEGLGIVTIEAQAGGIPCIVSSGVPKSVDMGLNLVDFLPIDDSDIWVNLILQNQDRKVNDKDLIKQRISQKGFDINQSIDLVEKMYLEG